jgi:hypothetical protein
MAIPKVTIQIEVPDDLADDYERHAKMTGRTISELVSASMQLYLARHATGPFAQCEGKVRDLTPGDSRTEKRSP